MELVQNIILIRLALDFRNEFCRVIVHADRGQGGWFGRFIFIVVCRMAAVVVIRERR